MKCGLKYQRTILTTHTLLSYRVGDFYPPGGHCCVTIRDGQGQQNIMIFGGANLREEATWPNAATIKLMQRIFDDNVFVEAISDVKFGQDAMSPLQATGSGFLQQKVFVFGCMNTCTLALTSQLIASDHQSSNNL